MNFGYGLWHTSFTPFLSYGFLNILVSGIYVGLVLGVYRNSRILGEGKAAGLKAERPRLVIETKKTGNN